MIHGMVLVRNEAGKDRFLKQFLIQMKLLCDRVVVIDDKSTDDTIKTCENFGAEVYSSPERLWNKNELVQRARLWEQTIRKANDNDWIICLDADELFCPDHLNYIKYVFQSIKNTMINGIGFRLFDMWSSSHYREDTFWRAHLRQWPMAVRYKKHFKYEWLQKPLHCGRFPLNAASACIPTQIPIKHMSFSNDALRQAKYSQYMEADPDGKYGIIDQYESILDKNPNLIKFE